MSGLEWTPPKGRIDEGEDTMEAAFREAREEAGLEVDMMTVYNDIQGSVGTNYSNYIFNYSNSWDQIVVLFIHYSNYSNS